MEPLASPGPITIEAHLAHAEPGRRVVEVSAWLEGQCLGRCLGEADSAESAEDRARARLEQRLMAGMPARTPMPPVQTPAAVSDQDPAAVPRPRPAPPQRMQATAAASSPAPPASAAAKPAASTTDATSSTPQLPLLGLTQAAPEPTAEEPTADPEDWSEELAELDVQLQRLGWDRSQESTYLQRAFGHPSRNRLTAFADLVAYLRALRGLSHGTSPESAPVPLRRRDLLSQCDQLLNSLGWDPQRGRELLERSFQLSSRQQLSDEQLLQFNMLLESELIGCGSSPAAVASPG